MRVTRAGRKRAGLGGEEADREGLREARERDLVRDVLAERLPERDLDEIDADGVPHEVGHLAAGDPRGDLDDCDAAVRRGDELRERDRVAEAERAHRLDRDLLGEAQLLGRDRRRVDVDPADAEADSGRAQAVGERDQRGLAAARDDDAVQLDAVDELLEERLVGRRLLDRVGEVALELLARLDAEDGALAARVDRLQDGREGDGARARRRRPHASEGSRTAVAEARLAPSASRIARLWVRRCAVCVPMPGSPSSSATAATTGTARSADTVSTPSTPITSRDLDDLGDGREVDDLRDVGRREARALRRCDRPRRRAGRGRAPARSHGADGARRRRREPSSRRPMLTAARVAT